MRSCSSKTCTRSDPKTTEKRFKFSMIYGNRETNSNLLIESSTTAITRWASTDVSFFLTGSRTLRGSEVSLTFSFCFSFALGRVCSKLEATEPVVSALITAATAAILVFRGLCLGRRLSPREPSPLSRDKNANKVQWWYLCITTPF